jgi:hypothetical protein
VVVYNDLPEFCDAVAATYRTRDGRLRLWRSTNFRTLLFEGPLSDPHEKTVFDKAHDNLFSVPTSLRTLLKPQSCKQAKQFGLTSAALYLKNVYEIADNELLGFVHLEYFRGCRNGGVWYPAVYRIGLAHSFDGGRSWRFLGDIVGVHNDDFRGGCTWAGSPIPGVNCNVGGVPYLVVDGWFYVYFNETSKGTIIQYPAVARARVTDVVAAARNDRLTVWRKFDANGWAENGISGLGARLLDPPVAGAGLDTHHDAAYCESLGEYLMTVGVPVHAGSAIDRLYLYRSADGLTWREPLCIAESESRFHGTAFSYFASTDADASRDCSRVGKRFSIFYIDQNPAEHQLPVYRVDVEIR